MEEKRKHTRKKEEAEQIEKKKKGNEPLKILEGSFPFKPGEGDLGAFRQKSRRVDEELGKLSLTEKQSIVLDFITHHISVVGFPPTVRQISEYFGISPKAGHDHIRSIAKKGYLRLFPGSARGMELVINPHGKEVQGQSLENMEDVIFVPLIGTIAAGVPILAEENIETSIPMPKSFMPQSGTFFALRVKGDSMVKAGIMDGDISIIKRVDDVDNEIQNGDIVAALIDTEATLKTFRRTENAIILQPENDNYKPILLTSRDQSQIMGKLVGVYRKY